MATTAQLTFVLSGLVSITVSSDMFRQVGSSVQLDMQGPVPEFDELIWMFNRTENVLKYIKTYKDVRPSSSYKDRVEFSIKTYSLTLKNLLKTDSGLYEAKVSGEQDKCIAVYNLSVFDKIDELKQPEWVFPVLVLVGLSAVLVIIIYCYLKRSRSAGRVQCENTVYEEIGNPTQPFLQDKGAGTESMSMLETTPSTTMYSSVGKKPQRPSPVQCVNTIYAKVEHPKTKMDQGIHDTNEIVPDNANPVMPETIYSNVSTVSKPVKPNRRKPLQL